MGKKSCHNFVVRDLGLGPGRAPCAEMIMTLERETRFAIDPTGFEVAIDQAGGYREEKIALPPGWLRGFMQLQAAMSLPMRRVGISREGLGGAWAREPGDGGGP